MRNVLLLLLCLALTGCYANMYANMANMPANSQVMASETSESVKSYVQYNKTTNTDILRKYANPSEKLSYSDGTFKYVYNYTHLDTVKSGKLFGNVVGHKLSKTFEFTFNSKKLLIDFKFHNNAFEAYNTYDGLGQEKKYLISDKEIGQISIGDSKGKLFRIMGTPQSVEKEKSKEIWKYKYFAENSAYNPNQKHIGILQFNFAHVYFIVQDNVLKSKLFETQALLDDEEKEILGISPAKK